MNKQPSARRVLFVCNGNRFRSYSAEYLLRNHLQKQNISNWDISSAGTTAKKHSIHPQVIKKLHQLGVENTEHAQQKLTPDHLKKYDIVIAFAEDQIAFLKKKFKYDHAVLFNDFAYEQQTSIWDIGDRVTDSRHHPENVNRMIDSTLDHINNALPHLVQAIERRVYLFEDFISGYKKHEHGYPFIPLYESNHVVAFMSISIPTKQDGHILVIPKKRFVHFHELPTKIANELLSVINLIGKGLLLTHDGYNLLVNNNRAAGQYIHHVHAHLIPRKYHDGIKMQEWTHKKMTPGEFRKLNTNLRTIIKKYSLS